MNIYLNIEDDKFVIKVDTIEIELTKTLYDLYYLYIETKKNRNKDNQRLLSFLSSFKYYIESILKYLSNYFSLLEISDFQLKSNDKYLLSLVEREFNKIKTNIVLKENAMYINKIKIDNIDLELDRKYSAISLEKLKARRQRHIEYLEYRRSKR